MSIDPINFAAILAMGALTYFTRILGFLIAVVYHYSMGGYGALALRRARHR